MEIDTTKTVKVNAKKLSILLKVRDEFYCKLYDADGELLKDYDGYVPDIMPGEHYGDYVELDIDVDTGQITNWEKLDKEDIEKFIRPEQED